MRWIWFPLKAVFFSLLAAGAGGMAAGVAFGLTGFDFLKFAEHPQNSVLAFGLIVVPWVLLSGLVGGGFGMLLGFVPTFLLGSTLFFLHKLRRVHLLVWMAAGAITGVVIAAWDPIGLSPSGGQTDMRLQWGAAWVAGGAVAMATYWLLVTRIFSPLPKEQSEPAGA